MFSLKHCLRKSSWRIVAVAFAAIASIALFACGGDSNGGDGDGDGGSTEPIIVGSVMPLTPPGDVQGAKTVTDAFQLAIDEINADGGVLGGRELVLQIEDSQGKPAAATAAARKLGQDGAAVILGEWESSVTLQVGEVAHQMGIPQLVTASADDAITGRGYPEVFRNAPYNAQYSDYILNFVQDMGFKKVGLSVESSGYGQTQEKAFRALIEEGGLDVELITETHAAGANDLTPQLLALKNAGVDLVLHAASGSPNTYLIMKQARETGLVPGATVLGFWDFPTLPDYWEINGPDGVGITYLTFFHPEIPLATDTGKAFQENFAAKFDYEPSYFSYLGYDAVLAFADAVERAGSTEPEAVIEALGETDIEGTLGQVVFESTGGVINNQVVNQTGLIVQMTEPEQSPNDAAVVWPEDVANAELMTK